MHYAIYIYIYIYLGICLKYIYVLCNIFTYTILKKERIFVHALSIIKNIYLFVYYNFI